MLILKFSVVILEGSCSRTNNNFIMASNQTFLLSFTYIIVHVTGLTFGQVQYFSYYSCNFSIGDSTYIDNLNTVLSSISSNLAAPGFYNFSFGQNLERVNAVALCKGNIDSDTCLSCVKNSVTKLIELCVNRKEAIGWHDNCMLRYSDRSIFNTLEKQPAYCDAPIRSTWNITQFNSTMNNLMATLQREATTKSSKFAYGNLSFGDKVMINGTVQCTPDLSEHQCNDCLNDVLGVVSSCFLGKVNGIAATPSCNIRYDTQLTNKVDNTGSAPPNSGSSAPPNSGWKTKKTAITISTSLVGAVLLGFCCICYCRRRIRDAREENCQEVRLIDLAGEMLGDNQDLPLIPLDAIRTATQHFSKENKLGEGGFGPVYKGTLVDGKEIAVKRLSRNSGQGLQEFKAEVTLIARLQHRNLVQLFGCCMEENELILVYDYMSNGSLDSILFDSTRGTELDWQTRHRIIKGIARGLLYLHEDSLLKIIHRDLKSSNVLLDNEINPRISDFGMARIFGSNQSEANTNRVVGTFGYMAPEYTTHGVFSDKSDVFSFGVLLLEIVSGKKTSRFHLSGHGPSLLTFVWKLWGNGQGIELMDPVLMQTYVEKDVLKCIHIGLLCVQEDPANRPSMSSVVFMLERHIMSLPQPTEPAFFSERNVQFAAPQLIQNYAGSSINEISFSAISPR